LFSFIDLRTRHIRVRAPLWSQRISRTSVRLLEVFKVRSRDSQGNEGLVPRCPRSSPMIAFVQWFLDFREKRKTQNSGSLASISARRVQDRCWLRLPPFKCDLPQLLASAEISVLFHLRHRPPHPQFSLPVDTPYAMGCPDASPHFSAWPSHSDVLMAVSR